MPIATKIPDTIGEGTNQSIVEIGILLAAAESTILNQNIRIN
jgi:hypothetical protein